MWANPASRAVCSTTPKPFRVSKKTRESLHAHLTVTASKHTVEEIDQNASEKEVTVWKITDQDTSDDFGPEAKIFTTRGLARVEVDKTSYLLERGWKGRCQRRYQGARRDRW